MIRSVAHTRTLANDPSNERSQAPPASPPHNIANKVVLRPEMAGFDVGDRGLNALFRSTVFFRSLNFFGKWQQRNSKNPK